MWRLRAGRLFPASQPLDRDLRSSVCLSSPIASRLRAVIGFRMFGAEEHAEGLLWRRTHNLTVPFPALTRPPVRGIFHGTNEVREDRHGKDRDDYNKPGGRCFYDR